MNIFLGKTHNKQIQIPNKLLQEGKGIIDEAVKGINGDESLFFYMVFLWCVSLNQSKMRVLVLWITVETSSGKKGQDMQRF